MHVLCTRTGIHITCYIDKTIHYITMHTHTDTLKQVYIYIVPRPIS